MTSSYLKKYIKSVVLQEISNQKKSKFRLNEMAKQVYTIGNIQASFDDTNSRISKQPWSGGKSAFKNRVYVKNTETGAKIFFDMHGSVADYGSNKPTDIKSALASFLKDADAGFQFSDPEELADNYGYDMETNRAEVRRIFKSVQGAAAKVEKLDLSHDDVIDMLNGELSDY